MYIPDSTGAGKSAAEIVGEYYGADIWVTEEEQDNVDENRIYATGQSAGILSGGIIPETKRE
ncbi:MAG: hypothetical protein EOM40_03610 [Clostridia bacterium]|nr:hypothetical protein [Clostridia bacterium]